MANPIRYLMVKAEAFLKMSCRDTSALVSEMLDHDLSFANKVRLRLHLALCKLCRSYRDQLLAIHNLCVRLAGEDAPPVQPAGLTDQQKARITAALQKEPPDPQ